MSITSRSIRSFDASPSFGKAKETRAEPGWGFRPLTMISLAAGTAFIMWMGEQITERGIGNGISLIIFAGIVARVPQAALAPLMAAAPSSKA